MSTIIYAELRGYGGKLMKHLLRGMTADQIAFCAESVVRAAATPIFVYLGEARLPADAGTKIIYVLDGSEIGNLVRHDAGLTLPAATKMHGWC